MLFIMLLMTLEAAKFQNIVVVIDDVPVSCDNVSGTIYLRYNISVQDKIQQDHCTINFCNETR